MKILKSSHVLHSILYSTNIMTKQRQTSLDISATCSNISASTARLLDGYSMSATPNLFIVNKTSTMAKGITREMFLFLAKVSHCVNRVQTHHRAPCSSLCHNFWYFCSLANSWENSFDLIWYRASLKKEWIRISECFMPFLLFWWVPRKDIYLPLKLTSARSFCI